MKRVVLGILAMLSFIAPTWGQQTQTLPPVYQETQPNITRDGIITTTWSTGAEKGTYTQFFNEIQGVCGAENPMQAFRGPKGQWPSGSRENISNALGNKASLFFSQMDAVFARRDIERDPEIDNIKTLMMLYPEEIHPIVKRNSRASNYIHRFSDFNNKKVGTWGGSLITTYVLAYKTGVRPTVKEYPGQVEAIDALVKEEVDAVLAVGGQPLTWLADNQQLMLVPFDRKDAALQAPAGGQSPYRLAAPLSYMGLGQTGIETVAVMSGLFTMNYSSPRMTSAITRIRRCIVDNLADLKELPGMHPKWRLVNPEDKGPWPIYEAAWNPKTPTTVPLKKPQPQTR